MDYQPYPKQREFHKLGLQAVHRLLLQANQVGATTACAAEIAFHLAGEYPDWWEGARYSPHASPVLLSGPTMTHVDFIMREPLAKLAIRIPTGAVHWHTWDNGCTSDDFPDSFSIVWIECEPNFILHRGLLSLVKPGGMSLMNFTPLYGLSNIIRPYVEGHCDGQFRSLRMAWTDALHLPEDWPEKTRGMERPRFDGRVEEPAISSAKLLESTDTPEIAGAIGRKTRGA